MDDLWALIIGLNSLVIITSAILAITHYYDAVYDKTVSELLKSIEDKKFNPLSFTKDSYNDDFSQSKIADLGQQLDLILAKLQNNKARKLVLPIILLISSYFFYLLFYIVIVVSVIGIIEVEGLTIISISMSVGSNAFSLDINNLYYHILLIFSVVLIFTYFYAMHYIYVIRSKQRDITSEVNQLNELYSNVERFVLSQKRKTNGRDS